MFDAQTQQRLEEWAEGGCAPDGLSEADAWLLAVDDDLAKQVFATKSEAFQAGVRFPPAHQERLREPSVTAEQRRSAGRRINPDTAEVWFEYGETLDPYGEGDRPGERSQIGRNFFAMDPVDRIPVVFGDLDAELRGTLESKRVHADREGWNDFEAQEAAFDEADRTVEESLGSALRPWVTRNAKVGSHGLTEIVGYAIEAYLDEIHTRSTAGSSSKTPSIVKQTGPQSTGGRLIPFRRS